MALSDEWTEHHLTENGWVEGSNRVDGAGTTTNIDPDGSLLVCRYSERQLSMFSKMERSVDYIRGDRTDAKVIELLNKCGPCPESL